MKTLRICVLTGILSAAVCVNATDFSKKSDAELIKLAGTVSVADYPDYKIEISKRLKAKSEKDAKTFHEKLHAQQEKATENMTLKAWREYKKATHEAMEKRMEKMIQHPIYSVKK